jgi:hypothetical protein
LARNLILVVALAFSACSTVDIDNGPSNGSSIAAGDVVAIGRLENTGSAPFVYDPDDLLGHGWFYANFHVESIESGSLPSDVIEVRYYAHTTRQEGQTIRFRLRPIAEGGYIICAPPGGAGFRCD